MRIVVERGVEVPMRDGVRLRADVYRPERPARHPALLQRTAYDRTSSLVSAHLVGLEPLRAVEAGYVVVIQDVRGRFASGGEFEPFANEARDGFDSVAWVAAQPWSNGRVGTVGASYVGATQLLAAAAQPPALHAIAPHLTASDYHEGWTYQGGALQLGFVVAWALQLAGAQLARAAARGADVAAAAAELAALLEPEDAVYRRLPVAALPLVERWLPAFRDWVAHPARDGYWRALAPNERYGLVRAPALHIGGWFDIFLKGTLENFCGLGGRLLVGPWGHGIPYDWAGEEFFGPASSQPALDMTRVHLDWFDAFLRDGAPGRAEGPPVRIFVQGANRWRDEDGWPPPRMRVEEWHLRARGRLTREPPSADELADEYVYDPADPVPTVGGQTFLPGVFVGANAGPRDQRAVEARPDVLVYTSEPLPHDVEVTGPVTATLWAATSARDTDWTAKLVDVFPDGRALGVTDGILRARYRHGLDAPRLVEPDAVERYELDLVATSRVFRAGHRLRLQVSSSDFPRFDRNPNHGGDVATATEADFLVARQRVFHDAARPSLLRLPVVP